jgi:cobalt/nickel transport system permease protein
MTLAPAAPPAVADSPVAGLDPRWRLAGLLALAAAAAAVRSPAAAAGGLGVALAVAAAARLPARWLGERLAVLALAVLPVVILWPLTAGGLAALPDAAAVLLRALAVGTLGLTLLAAAPLPVTLHAAQSLGAPRLLVHLSLLSFRYVFLLADELARLRTAVRVRGFRNRADAHAYRTVGCVVGTLVARGSDRAERVAAAMRCRGFHGGFRTLTAFRTHVTDVMALTLAAAVAVGLLAWDWSLRWAA